MVNDDGGVNEVVQVDSFNISKWKLEVKQMKETKNDVVEKSLAYDYAEVIKEVL